MAVLLFSLCVLAAVLPAIAQPQKNLLQNAVFFGATNFTDFMAKAGLDTVLKTPGNITVFAPTNDAFSALPPEVLQLLENDQTILTTVLSYHLTTGLIVASALQNDELITSSSGANLRFNKYNVNGDVRATVSGSKAILSDLPSNNGYLFLMDRVIYPVPTGSALDYVNAEGSLTTLLLALTRASLSDLFAGDNLTVFAPSNTAFSRLPAGALDNLLSDIPKLQDVLKLHVVNTGTYYSAGLYQGEQLTADNGGQLSFTENNGLFVNGKKISDSDVTVSNGVVHIIDDVLLPPSLVYGL